MDDNNNFLTNEDKMKIAIQRRKITILKKRLLKAEKKLNNIEKRVIHAGESYLQNIIAEPNPKFIIHHIEESTRERKKYEKHIIKQTSGINEMFIIKTLNNVELLNKTTNMDVVIYDGNFNLVTVEKEMIEPNYEYIKREISNIFYKAITERNLYKISQYITIKFTIDSIKYYFNSDISVLKSVKSLQPMINSILDEFELFINSGIGHKSGGAFTGIIKIDVKMNKSKQIYGASYVELPKFIKNKKACINIKNVLSCKNYLTIYDNKCFLWALLAYKHYDDVKK